MWEGSHLCGLVIDTGNRQTLWFSRPVALKVRSHQSVQRQCPSQGWLRRATLRLVVYFKERIGKRVRYRNWDVFKIINEIQQYKDTSRLECKQEARTPLNFSFLITLKKKVHHLNKELNYKRQFYFLYEYWMPLTCINTLLFETCAVKLTTSIEHKAVYLDYGTVFRKG